MEPSILIVGIFWTIFGFFTWAVVVVAVVAAAAVAASVLGSC